MWDEALNVAYGFVRLQFNTSALTVILVKVCGQNGEAFWELSERSPSTAKA